MNPDELKEVLAACYDRRLTLREQIQHDDQLIRDGSYHPIYAESDIQHYRAAKHRRLTHLELAIAHLESHHVLPETRSEHPRPGAS